MRILLFCALLAAACGGSGRAVTSTTAPSERVRVIYNQYRGDSSVFVMENLAGRDLAELRTRKLRPGERPVAFVPDDVMERMLREFRRYDWEEHAVPRPANPSRLGAAGEITIVGADGRQRSLLRVKAPAGSYPTPAQVAAGKAYVNCANTYIAVWNAYPPEMQATASTGDFGVKRAQHGSR